MGATLAPDEAWVSSLPGSIIIEGSILRPAAQAGFAQAALQAKLTGGGQIVASDYLHLPLTPSSNIILFAFVVQEVTQGSKVQFSLDNLDTEVLSFQTNFFRNGCSNEEFILNSEFVDRLPIEKQKPDTTE